MGINIETVQLILNNLIEVGASYIVLSDMNGLAIAEATKSLDEDETTEAMGALSSIVIPQGDQIASYLNSEFRDTIVHLSGRTVLAFSLNSDPKTAIMIICDPPIEAQVLHEFNTIKRKLVNSLEGIAVEIRASAEAEFATANRKIVSFWDTLIEQIKNATDANTMKRSLLDAKDNYLQIHGRFSPILYQMNSLSNKCSGNIANFDVFKMNSLKEIEVWKRRAIGLKEENDEESKE